MEKKLYLFTSMELRDGWSDLLKRLQKYFTLGQKTERKDLAYCKMQGFNSYVYCVPIQVP